MVKLTAQDKARIKEAQEIEAQLRASANGASKLVSSWLSATTSESDSEDEKPQAKAKDIFKGRPARLGVGAKFLSHKEMMAAGGNGVLTSKELLLKRKLAAGNPPRQEELSSGADGNSGMKAADADEDEEDSKSRVVASLSGSSKSGGSGMGKKRSKTSDYLDSLVKRRKR